MDFNYTLKYRTFDQLLEDVTIDLHTFALENMIEPQQLIKLVRKVNYQLGLRINQTKEVVLDVCHHKVKLPDDFYTFNYALLCGEYHEVIGYDGYAGGTNIQEVPYKEFPSSVNQCATPTVNCSVCGSNPCNHTAACPDNTCPATCTPVAIPDSVDPLNPYGDTCIRPRVFLNCKGEAYELVQIINPSTTRVFRSLKPLRMKSSQEIECECPNLYYNTLDQGWIKDGYLNTTFESGKVYLNYQGDLSDDNGNLLVPDHELLNDYYEYALKQRIFENLFLNGEDVAQRMQVVEARLREARNNALSLVNTPNFKEMEKLWWTNRKAMYGKYYYMFMSYSPNAPFRRGNTNNRVI
jgi:hypothetical protein